MCSGIALLIGLVLIGKGDFRIANRYIAKERGRMIGFILVAPFVIGVCAGLVLLPAAVGSGPNVDLTDLVNSPAYLTVATLELIAFVVAVVAALALIFSEKPNAPGSSIPNATPYSPPSASYPFGGASTPAPAAPPSIMTTGQAAEYLRVTEAEIERLIDEGKLPAARTASGYRIARSAIDDFVRGGSA
ncbi:MAG: helix-turn-helix domain-containing protein [bacterium]|nr:helix-turn-helix domain-containing protein [bacterium]